MASTTKKGSKNNKPRSRRPKAKTSAAEEAQAIVELRRQLEDRNQQLAESAKELQDCKRQFAEAFEQQTSTSDVLRIIASSPTELQPVLDTVIANAVKLAGAKKGHILLYDGELLRLAAHCNESPEEVAIQRDMPVRLVPESLNGRAFLERKPVQRLDAQTEPNYEGPGRKAGARTALAVPMLREGSPIGTLLIWREFVQSFTERQVDLVKTFADQAVIAIENVRLFQELQVRNRDLTEALDQQTATSKILEVIASSPTDLQPVMDAIAESAARLCGADDALIFRLEGDSLKRFANFGSLPGELGGGPRGIDQNSIPGRAVIAREMLHIHDLAAIPEAELPALFARRLGIRTALAAPLLREGTPIGVIMIRRTEVQPFTEKQIALLKTFADQAVIAIENVRLFKELQERNAELREALEHQTATSEVLSIISRSPTDVQPVLDAIVESAARVCGIDDVALRLREGNTMVVRAHFGPIPTGRVEINIDDPRFRWMREHGTLHIPDTRTQNDFPMLGSTTNARTFLFVPLRQQRELIGNLTARRIEVRSFTSAQIKLLETFADQAVIALENVRLFQELKESLEQQTATSEILGVIASSPTDIQPVLDIVAQNAARLCDASDASIWRTDGDKYWLVASHGSLPVPRSEESRPITRSRPSGRAMFDKETVHVHDILSPDSLAEFPEAVRIGGVRTVLATPLLREGLVIGAIHIRRDGSPSIHGKTNSSSQNLRRSGGDRDRECSPVQGAPGA